MVLADLRAADKSLLVTGYASLDRLIDFLADTAPHAEDVRLLLGNEPYPAQSEHLSVEHRAFSEEMTAYWLQRGISLRLSAKIVSVIELLRQGRVRARGSIYLAVDTCAQTAQHSAGCTDRLSALVWWLFPRITANGSIPALNSMVKKAISARFSSPLPGAGLARTNYLTHTSGTTETFPG